MALQTIKGGLVIPPAPVGLTAAPSFAAVMVIDAADESAAWVVVVPKTGNIRKVLWATRTVTTGATVDVRLETLSRAATPSVPSGTLWGTNANGAQVVAAADDNVSFATQLTADAAVTAGDRIAVRINNPNTSFGNMQIAGVNDDDAAGLPYCLLNTGASPTVSFAVVAGTPIMAFEYDDGTYETVDGCWPINTAITSTAISTSTTPDSVGTRFQLPFPATARGCWVWLDADGDFVVKLVSTAYHQVNGTGILAQTPTINKEDRDTTNGTLLWLQFIAPANLAANTNYRLIIEGTTTTSLTVYDFDLKSLAALDAFWGGQTWHLTTAKDPTGDGDWTNFNSGTFRKMVIGLKLSAFDDAVSAGGGGRGNIIAG